jgi:hypothetical protein
MPRRAARVSSHVDTHRNRDDQRIQLEYGATVEIASMRGDRRHCAGVCADISTHAGEFRPSQ